MNGLYFLSFLLIGVDFSVFVLGNKYNQILYNAVPDETFKKYTDEWNSYHQSWINIDPNQRFCQNNTQITYFPVCYEGFTFIPNPWSSFGQLHDDICPQALCIDRINHDCFPTPSDTIEYAPPQLQNLTNDVDICPYDGPDPYISTYSYGFDQGIPPTFNHITPIRLVISGNIFGVHNDKKICRNLANAKIVAWQLNPLALTKVSLHADQSNQNIGDNKAKPTSNIIKDFRNLSSFSLRESSCIAVQYSQENGSYSFHTLLPPSYGSPRTVFFQISQDGYETLTTRLYFDKDLRLQQLTTLGGPEGLAKFLGSERMRHSFSTDNFDTEKTVFPGIISEDPRVAKVLFISKDPRGTHTSVPHDMLIGHLKVNHDFTLSAKRDTTFPNPETPATPLINIDGIWIEENTGTRLSITTYGNCFFAKEIPHLNNWGVITGYLVDNTIRGISFFDRSLYKQLADKIKSIQQSPSTSPEVQDPLGIELQTDEDTADTITPLTNSLLQTTLSLQSSNLMSGTIIPSDSFSTVSYNSGNNNQRIDIAHYKNVDNLKQVAGTIVWNSGQDVASQRVWRRIDSVLDGGYRYIKLVITRVMNDQLISQSNPQTRNFNSNTGELIINEISFYEGYFTEKKLPSENMKSPRYPTPLMTTCSSFSSQENHCFKAFDGDSSSSSSWRTQPIRSYNNLLNPPQWILLDFGQGHGIKPTGIRIVCDIANAVGSTTARGCPMTFSVLVSHDNVQFETVFKEDLYQYADLSPDSLVNPFYGVDGRMFYFVSENSKGRNNGDKCGSCDTGPQFQCHYNAYDGYCDSRYCDSQGFCNNPPVCPAGKYLDLEYNNYEQLTYSCKLCPAGRYGNHSGLVTSFCSGLCQAGYYCPEGSTSPSQIPCGSVHQYCPAGSSFPFPSPSGKKTVSIFAGDSSGLFQYKTVDCSLGHYCTNGLEYPCPLGVYGNLTALQVSTCSGHCPPGNYCPPGSVVPTKCPKGFYCPDGKVFLPCPAGTFGAATGLSSVTCSGYCEKGHYCLDASTSATSRQCPRGRFGSIFGLTNANCSGLCSPGFYCPVGSVSAEQVPCGGSDVYCPVGSYEPTPVTPGYFTIGGSSPQTRTGQQIATKGFFALEGIEFPCPAGTFGNVSGINGNNKESPIYTLSPAAVPSQSPSFTPTVTPSSSPFQGPTKPPTASPTATPSPTKAPTLSPSRTPTIHPTRDINVTEIEYLSTFTPTVSPTTPDLFVPKRFYCTGNFPILSLTISPLTRSGWLVGLCEKGFYCPVNSTSSTQEPCPAGRYGEIIGLTNALCTGLCPLGHYCPQASVQPIPCPSGVFGAFVGLIDSTCSNDCREGVGCNVTSSLCAPGYFCPIGSISATQYECGGPGPFP